MLGPIRLKIRDMFILYLVNTLDSNEKNVYILVHLTFKLFLDMASISSEDVTRPMRGQPKLLSRNYMKRNGGNVIASILTVS